MHPNQHATPRQRVLDHASSINAGGFFNLLAAPQLLDRKLIRLPMAQAALPADQIPRQLSFKHRGQIWMSWQQRGGGTHDGVVIRALLVLIAEPRGGLRPGRIEPRALKRHLRTIRC